MEPKERPSYSRLENVWFAMGCCAYQNLSKFHMPKDFGPYLQEVLDTLDTMIDYLAYKSVNGYTYNAPVEDDTTRALIITLTDGQLEGWWEHLEPRGFKVVHAMRNANGGNVVNLLIRQGQPTTLPNKPWRT